MKYQSTTPIFWFCRQLRGFSCLCKDVIHMHRLNMNMRLTQECHQDIRSFVRHLSKGYTSSNNRGGYKFRRVTYLIWEPALFFFFFLDMSDRRLLAITRVADPSDRCNEKQLELKFTKKTQKTPTVFPCRSHSSGEPAPPQAHGKSTTLMLLRPLASAMFLLVAPRVQQGF